MANQRSEEKTKNKKSKEDPKPSLDPLSIPFELNYRQFSYPAFFRGGRTKHLFTLSILNYYTTTIK